MQRRMEKHFGVTKCTGGVMTDQMMEKENMTFTFSWTAKNRGKKKVHLSLSQLKDPKGLPFSKDFFSRILESLQKILQLF